MMKQVSIISPSVLDSWTAVSVHLNGSCLADAGPLHSLTLSSAVREFWANLSRAALKITSSRIFFIYTKSVRGKLDQSDQPNLDLLMEPWLSAYAAFSSRTERLWTSNFEKCIITALDVDLAALLTPHVLSTEVAKWTKTRFLCETTRSIKKYHRLRL